MLSSGASRGRLSCPRACVALRTMRLVAERHRYSSLSAHYYLLPQYQLPVGDGHDIRTRRRVHRDFRIALPQRLGHYGSPGHVVQFHPAVRPRADAYRTVVIRGGNRVRRLGNLMPNELNQSRTAWFARLARRGPTGSGGGRSSGACSADIHALAGKHPFFRCPHRLGHGPVKP